jgi:MOSC domain-containing protein YiiM
MGDHPLFLFTSLRAVSTMCSGKVEMMKLISINVGLPRELMWKGRRVTTSIFKETVAGRVKLRRLNLDGDRQADLSVHGGSNKAVYLYPSEHYDYWREKLLDMPLPWGMFGENFTTEGLLESEVYVGDRFRIGTAEVIATEPRMPCYKLGIKFGRDDIIKLFLTSRRTGFYLAVLKEGEVAAGDEIEIIGRDASQVRVADIISLYVDKDVDFDLLNRAARVEALGESWRRHFAKKLDSQLKESNS